MPDVTNAELPPAITDQHQAEGMQPVEDADAMKKVTHEVASDDMFRPTV